MTTTPLHGALSTLKQTGIRITPQRQAILEYLSTTTTHPTADEIYKALEGKFPNMSVATIYNNLRVFKANGLVNELNYGDASSRFDFNTNRHYHILCEDCGKIVDFQYPGLDVIEDVASSVSGFEITKHRLEIYGKCEACSKKSAH